MVFAELAFMVIHFRVLGTPDAGGESQGIEVCLGVQHGLFRCAPVQVHIGQLRFRKDIFPELWQGDSVEIQVFQGGSCKSLVSDAFETGGEVCLPERGVIKSSFSDSTDRRGERDGLQPGRAET